ncbi:MAG TPA: permease-like cell division protein FtsX [Candidatus Paceibacterota bacterium]|nr:permease-like cell division protein FtsX [Candidatus Paceibacterota bacterium]
MPLWTNIKRVARYGLVGFIRNGFVSLAAVFIMTITLFVVAALLISGAALTSVLTSLTNQVDVTVYFTQDATSDQIHQIQQQLAALPQVASTTYISADQALAEFQARHSNDQLTMQALQELGDNPLGAELQVRAKETSQYPAIAQYLQNQQASAAGGAIDKVNYQQNETAITRLSNIIDTSRKLGIAIGIILAAASLLITFNTIRLAIYTARDEIGVMNIVGAGRWYVRGPFIVTGVLYGVISAVVVLLVLYPVTLSFGDSSQAFFGTFNVFSYFIDHSLLFFATIFGCGIALGALSSYLAVRRYLTM